jgi:hypothetical protein
MMGSKKNSDEPTEFKSVLSRMTSHFGTFQQPIKFIVVGSTAVGFGGKAPNDELFWNSITVSW